MVGIYGCRCEAVQELWLANSIDVDDFCAKLESLRETWDDFCQCSRHLPPQS